MSRFSSDDVRKKVELKYDMSVLAHPKYHIERHGEKSDIKKMVSMVRGILEKYKAVAK